MVVKPLQAVALAVPPVGTPTHWVVALFHEQPVVVAQEAAVNGAQLMAVVAVVDPAQSVPFHEQPA